MKMHLTDIGTEAIAYFIPLPPPPPPPLAPLSPSPLIRSSVVCCVIYLQFKE